MKDHELQKALAEATGFHFTYPQVACFFFEDEGYFNEWIDDVCSLVPSLRNLPCLITDNGLIVMVYEEGSSLSISETIPLQENIPLSYVMKIPFVPACFLETMISSAKHIKLFHSRRSIEFSAPFQERHLMSVK